MAHTDDGMARPASKPSPQGRNGNGQFAPGNGGGPGRPRGYRSQIAQVFEDIDLEDMRAIRNETVAQAIAGNIQAAKIIWDRSSPAPKGRLVKFEFPEIESVADIPRATGALLKAVANGELSPDEAVTIASIVEQHRKALELADVEGRLSRVEEATSEETFVG